MVADMLQFCRWNNNLNDSQSIHWPVITCIIHSFTFSRNSNSCWIMQRNQVVKIHAFLQLNNLHIFFLFFEPVDILHVDYINIPFEWSFCKQTKKHKTIAKQNVNKTQLKLINGIVTFSKVQSVMKSVSKVHAWGSPFLVLCTAIWTVLGQELN